jgi:hypothetical protein
LLYGLGILLVVGLPIWFMIFAPRIRHERLEKHGVRVPGRLLNVEETGTEVNDSPELELTIEFRRADGRLDTAKTDFVPSLRSIHLFQPGVAIVAAYDSTDPHEITLVDFRDTPPTESVPASATHVVDSLRHAADSLQEELRKARERAR